MDDVAVIEDVLADNPRPASIKDVQVRLGNDSTNDPAAWVVLTVDSEIERSPEQLTELDDFASRLTMVLIQRLQSRWPYVDIQVRR